MNTVIDRSAPGVRLTLLAGSSFSSRARNDLEITCSRTELEPFVLEHPIPTLRGRVKSAERALEGLRVEVRSLSGLESGLGTTDAQGRFAVVGFAPGQTTVVRVYADAVSGDTLLFQDQVDLGEADLQLDL